LESEITGTGWGPRASAVRRAITRDDDIRERLRELGGSSNDVKVLLNTRLQWDHTGGNRFFRESVFILQKAEYRFALYPYRHLSAPYMGNYLPASGRSYRGCFWGIRGANPRTYRTGHQTVIVNLPEGGPDVLCGDAVCC